MTTSLRQLAVLGGDKPACPYCGVEDDRQDKHTIKFHKSKCNWGMTPHLHLTCFKCHNEWLLKSD
jgi:hypothetical protein